MAHSGSSPSKREWQEAATRFHISQTQRSARTPLLFPLQTFLKSKAMTGWCKVVAERCSWKKTNSNKWERYSSKRANGSINYNLFFLGVNTSGLITPNKENLPGAWWIFEGSKMDVRRQPWVSLSREQSRPSGKPDDQFTSWCHRTVGVHHDASCGNWGETQTSVLWCFFAETSRVFIFSPV